MNESWISFSNRLKEKVLYSSHQSVTYTSWGTNVTGSGIISEELTRLCFSTSVYLTRLNHGHEWALLKG